nr:uncharacterized protein LOC109174707 [Ipomoea batatas]
MDTGTSSKQGAGLEGDEVHEVDCELSEELFRSLEHSEESAGEVTGIDNVFQQTNLNKEGFKFEIGMIFKSAEEFKWAVKCHEATRRKDIHFKKNEGRRVRVVCRHNNTCNWTIFASRSNPRSHFAIKTYNPEHTCGDQDENRTVNSGFLAKLYKDDFKINTEWGRVQFQEHVKAKLKCQVTKHQAYRAKKKALKQLEACKEGFLRGCRPFFGIDGCHLNGPQKGGQLLSAVGVDGDNILFPIAFAIEEGELKDSWLWFLDLLDSDLNISSNPGAWTVISYKQKGLIPAIEELFPGMEHRFCVRHMHANFVKDGFTGNVLKQKLWAVCKATTKPEYKRQMEELKALNAKAAEWLDVAEMEEIAAGMEQVVAEEVQVEGQFEDIAIETQVPSFVLDEMAILNSQSSQAVQNQAPPLSEFISAQLPTESSTPTVITRSGKNYVTVATLQQSKAVQRETKKKRKTAKKK